MPKSCDSLNVSIFITVETYFWDPLEVVIKNRIPLAWERSWLTLGLG